MGSRILFAAGPQDMKELNTFIRSLGVYLVPPGPSIEYSDDELVLGGCYISLVPKDELKPDSRYPHRYSSRNPILSFTRSVYRAPYLRPGDIYWNNDNKDVATRTKSVFQKIARWVRKNWPKPENDDWHFGPQALELASRGAIVTSLVPGVELIRIPVDTDD